MADRVVVVVVVVVVVCDEQKSHFGIFLLFS
jgi:hypothetical protein